MGCIHRPENAAPSRQDHQLGTGERRLGRESPSAFIVPLPGPGEVSEVEPNLRENEEDLFLRIDQEGVCLEGMTQNGENTNGDQTLIVAEAARLGTESAWILGADWGKWRTAQIRFDMPPSVTRFLKLNGLSFQFIGENLVTWTDYNGWDPEMNWAGQSQASVAEFLTLPPVRRFIGTINIFF